MILYKRGKVWHVAYSLTPGHRVRRSTKATRREDAEIIARRMLKRELNRDDIILGALVARYKQAAQLEKRSWRAERSQLRAIVEHFGVDTYLSEISAIDVQAFKTQLMEGRSTRGKRSPATINRYLALLKLLFNRAAEWGFFNQQNPVSKIKFSRESPRFRFFSVVEIQRLLVAAQRYERCQCLYPIVVTAILTGARLSEILNLRWQDYQDGFFLITRAKSGKRRQIPVRSELLRLLKTLPPAEFIFQVRRTPDALAKHWRQITHEAKLRDARFHDLRHTAATLMIQGGADPVSVQAILGHSSLAMTQVYSHASRESVERAIAALPMLVDPPT